MAPTDPHQASDFSADPFLHYTPHQPQNYAPQNVWAPPAPTNDQPEGRREDIPPPARGVTRPGRVQDPHHFDVAYQGVVDYQPQPVVGVSSSYLSATKPLFDQRHSSNRTPGYVFPDVGLPQGIPAQAQPNAPVQPFGYAPQYIEPPGPVQAVFPDPFVHRMPAPDRAGAENLRRIASRYLHHPDAQFEVVSMEAGAAGRFKVVIILESHDVL